MMNSAMKMMPLGSNSVTPWIESAMYKNKLAKKSKADKKGLKLRPPCPAKVRMNENKEEN